VECDCRQYNTRQINATLFANRCVLAQPSVAP